MGQYAMTLALSILEYFVSCSRWLFEFYDCQYLILAYDIFKLVYKKGWINHRKNKIESIRFVIKKTI